MLLLVPLQDRVDLLVNVFGVLDLDEFPRASESDPLRGYSLHPCTDRCSEIYDCLSCNVCLFVIILDFDIYDMNRLIEIAASREQI